MDSTEAPRIKIFIVMNPVAGFTDAKIFRKRIKRLCERRNCEVNIYETSEGEDLTQVIQQAIQSGYQVFVAAGGDGTISDVANSLVNTDLPLGVIPSGTGNALAKTLGLPHDLESAFNLITGQHAIRSMDVLHLFNKHHLLNAGVGVTSAVVVNTPRPIKRRLGIFAYLWQAAKVLVGIQPYSFQITVDGRRHRYRASEVFVACGGWLGVNLPFTDLDIQPDDGRVDVFVIKARNLGGYLQLFLNFIFKKPRKAPQMKYLAAKKEIIIESSRPLPVQSDGDWVGETPVKIQVCPGAVKMIVPAREGDVLTNLWRWIIQMTPPALVGKIDLKHPQ